MDADLRSHGTPKGKGGGGGVDKNCVDEEEEFAKETFEYHGVVLESVFEYNMTLLSQTV